MRVDAAGRVVVHAVVMVECWKSPREHEREGKGDVRKMRGGVGKTEEVDGCLGEGGTFGGGGNVSKSLISRSPKHSRVKARRCGRRKSEREGERER